MPLPFTKKRRFAMKLKDFIPPILIKIIKRERERERENSKAIPMH